MPDLTLEQTHSQNFKYIIGIDEVGRGPWAGPVVACASFITNINLMPATVADSKKLTDKKRQALDPQIKQATKYALGIVSAQEIDELNILQATFKAMHLALTNLITENSINIEDCFILVDGNKIPPFESFKNAESVIKGDDKSLTIAASSIIAKVYRDNAMAEYAKEYPFYGWEKNAGYGTKLHQEGLALHGITNLHRKSFKPIAKIINK